MATPGGIVEWAASDGRKGSLKGTGKTRSGAAKGTETATDKDGNGKRNEAAKKDSNNPHNFTEEEDKQLLDWKNEHGSKPWKDCAEVVGRSHVQCKERFKQLQAKDGDQNPGKAQGSGGVTSGKKSDDDAGANRHGFTEEEDRRMMEWRSENAKKPWTEFADEIGKTHKQCAERFREIKPSDWKPTESQGGGGGKGNKKSNKNDKKQEAAMAGTDTSGGDDNPFGGIGGYFGDNNDQSGGTNNDNTSGDAGNNTSWGNNNSGGNGETSWDQGAWGNNNSGGNGDTSGNNANNAWGDTTGQDNSGGGGDGDWGAMTGGNNNPGGNATGGGDAPWGTGGGGNDNSGGNNIGGGGDAWGAPAAGGDCGGNPGWGGGGSQKPASNGGGGADWGASGGDGADDTAAPAWGDNSNNQNNNTGGGGQNAWAGGNDTWGGAAAPAKIASKAGSKANTHRPASHKSSHHHNAENVTTAPVELEVKPDDVFSADDLRLVARILQQDYQMVWNRVSWRFKDKTGRTIAPEVFEKKITGRVEGREKEREKRDRRRK